jgi:hypothetical protein
VNDGAAERGPVLDDEQFRQLAEYGEVEHAEPGRDLYTSGDDTYDFFLLRSATRRVRSMTVLARVPRPAHLCGTRATGQGTWCRAACATGPSFHVSWDGWRRRPMTVRRLCAEAASST